jgi:RNA polymerase sigma factor (sigma-70 family)
MQRVRIDVGDSMRDRVRGEARRVTERQVDPGLLDTAALVAAARAGDEAALTALVTAHLPLVYRVVGRALRGHADVDDLVQETMILAIRGLPGLREPERFRSWLTAIAQRQVQLHRRNRQHARRRRQEVPPELPDPGSDFAERTVTALMLTEQRRELAEAARWLDRDDQRLLALWWREVAGDLTRAELAAALTVDAKHAGVRLQRMKARLDDVRAVVRALHASPRCADLTALTRTWNRREAELSGGSSPTPRTAPVWRKRLVRHLRGCPRCDRYRRGLVAPEQLLLGAVTLPLAAGLRAAGVPSSIWAAARKLFTRKVTAAAVVVTVASGGGFVYAVTESPAPPGGSRAALGPATTGTGPGASARPPAGGVTVADIYVAPGGSDAGTGTIRHPYATLGKAAAVVRPGQTIALRGGAYRPTAPVVITTSGTAAHRITLSNYRGERPVIDASRVPPAQWMVTQRAGYWTVQGLEIMHSGSHAYVCVSCRYDIFQRLSIHDNVRSSLALRGDGTIGNQVLDSDFFGNCDPTDEGRSGVGLEIKFGSGAGNLVRGNRSFDNADNGFDFGYYSSPVTLERNWAYGNGTNRWHLATWRSNADGFHLGGGRPVPTVAHVLRDNAAWDNVNNGFSNGGNPGALRLTDNTAFHNGATGFSLPGADATLRGNAAVDNKSPASFGRGTTLGGNTWESGSVTAAIFRSTDPATAQGPRSPDGTLPPTAFLDGGDGVGAAMRG